MNRSSEPHGERSTSAILTSIDAFRGAFVIGVVLFHHIWSSGVLENPQAPAWVREPAEWFAFGIARIPLFFVVSGFCLHMQASRLFVSGKADPAAYRTFLLRRAVRLYPAYVVALALYVAATVVAGEGHTGWLLARDVAAHLLLVQNLFRDTVDSFAVPLWAVAAVFQIYLLYPILLIWRARFGWGIALLLCFLARPAWAALCNLAERFWGAHLVADGIGVSYWFVWALGAMAGEAAAGRVQSPAMLRSFRWGVVLFAGAVVLALLRHGRVLQPALAVVVDTCMTAVWGCAYAVLIGGAARVERAAGPRFRLPAVLRMLAWVGVFSYSAYLVHAHSFFTAWLPGRIESWLGWTPTEGLLLRIAVLAPLSLACAWVFHLLFERRFLSETRKRALRAEREAR